MKTRFYNAKILTLDGDFYITDGELHVEDNKISYIGEEEPAGEHYDREVNVNGNLLMPGFKNAHTHSAMTFLRSFADDLPLQDWLFKQVFPMEAKLNEERVYWFTKLAYLEYITSGITSCFDMYFEPDGVMNAATDIGFRNVFCGSIGGGAENVERLSGYYEKYNGKNPLISYRLGFHAEYTAELEMMKELSRYANEVKQPVFVHNSETRKEVDECIEKYGKTPTQLFDSLGLYNYGGGGFHCVHMSNEDLSIYKEKGLYAVTNPASNLKLASGIAPITTMQSMGINLAIGTDGPASNNSLDMFKEMFLTTALQKIRENDASACPAGTVLAMAITGGAKAMGLDDCDYLAPGKLADIIMIDLQQPNMQPINNIVKNLVYSGSKQNVIMTMINGKILYENGKFNVGENPSDIYKKANELMADMLKA